MVDNNFIVDGCVFESSPFGPPESPGVYFVTVVSPKTGKKKVFYIGSSRNIRKRVTNQRHPYYILLNRLNNFLVITESFITKDYLELERVAIKKFKPVLNIIKYQNG